MDIPNCFSSSGCPASVTSSTTYSRPPQGHDKASKSQVLFNNVTQCIRQGFIALPAASLGEASGPGGSEGCVVPSTTAAPDPLADCSGLDESLTVHVCTCRGHVPSTVEILL